MIGGPFSNAAVNWSRQLFRLEIVGVKTLYSRRPALKPMCCFRPWDDPVLKRIIIAFEKEPGTVEAYPED